MITCPRSQVTVPLNGFSGGTALVGNRDSSASASPDPQSGEIVRLPTRGTACRCRIPETRLVACEAAASMGTSGLCGNDPARHNRSTMLANLLKQLLRPGATSSSRHSSREREQPPESTGRWLSEALLLQRDGRYPDVEARCRSVLASNPDSIDALNLLAAALCAQVTAGEGI